MLHQLPKLLSALTVPVHRPHGVLHLLLPTPRPSSHDHICSWSSGEGRVEQNISEKMGLHVQGK